MKKQHNLFRRKVLLASFFCALGFCFPDGCSEPIFFIKKGNLGSILHIHVINVGPANLSENSAIPPNILHIPDYIRFSWKKVLFLFARSHHTCFSSYLFFFILAGNTQFLSNFGLTRAQTRHNHHHPTQRNFGWSIASAASTSPRGWVYHIGCPAEGQENFFQGVFLHIVRFSSPASSKAHPGVYQNPASHDFPAQTSIPP